LPENALIVNKNQVCAFFEGRLYNEVIKNSRDIRREHRFNVELPAHLFTSDPARKEALSDEKLFIQGIIDCFVDNGDDTYTLIDYKTDHLPEEFRDEPVIFEKILAKRHCDQLKYYKTALEIITKKKVSRTYIYSFALNKEIDITKLLI
jgi:ATP-dependent helicase/nuclease subunit A